MSYLFVEVESLVQDESLCALSGKDRHILLGFDFYLDTLEPSVGAVICFMANVVIPHEQTESNFMIFTDDGAKRYEDFNDSDFVRTDDTLGIKYETVDIFEDTVLLLRYNCPDKDCDAACLGWPDLHRHVKSKHGKVMWYVWMLFTTWPGGLVSCMLTKCST